VAVDDRSTDRTAKSSLVRSEQRPGRVNPLRVDGLPECWLGKNHALYLGAEAAGGEWLLFTDADVRLSAGCVEDAIATPRVRISTTSPSRPS
jgi:glycosyltransferase involved in cell wall biosynthesis